MAIRKGPFQGKSALCLVWCSWFFCKWRKNLLVCRVALHDHLIHGQNNHVIEGSYHPIVKFGGHRYCVRKDIIFLVCQVT